jgi:hypothetical protein
MIAVAAAAAGNCTEKSPELTVWSPPKLNTAQALPDSVLL